MYRRRDYRRGKSLCPCRFTGSGMKIFLLLLLLLMMTVRIFDVGKAYYRNVDEEDAMLYDDEFGDAFKDNCNYGMVMRMRMGLR